MSKIYRAADAEAGRFWMTDRDNAIAYLDNGHLGGSTLYTAEISLDSLLDLTDAATRYAFLDSVLGDDWSAQYPDYTDALELPAAISEAKKYGKVGILFHDNFPADAEAVFVWDGITGTVDPDSELTAMEAREITWQEIEALKWSAVEGKTWSEIAELLKIDADRIDFVDADDEEITIKITNPGNVAEGIIER